MYIASEPVLTPRLLAAAPDTSPAPAGRPCPPLPRGSFENLAGSIGALLGQVLLHDSGFRAGEGDRDLVSFGDAFREMGPQAWHLPQLSLDAQALLPHGCRSAGRAPGRLKLPLQYVRQTAPTGLLNG
jgi:hypothetical protein